MTAPAVRQRPPHRPLEGSAWLAARLALALRRTRRFTRWWLGIGGTITVIALLLPVAAGDPDAASRLELERAAADTLRTGVTLRRLRGSAADAESLLVDARAARPTVPAAVRAPRDPRLTTLDAAIAMARATRGVPAYLTLAEDPAVRYGPRMQAIADSLRRATTDDERLRLGNTIIAIAEFRRNAIAGESAENEAPEPEPTLDTLAFATRAAALRDSLAAATRAHESAKEAVARIVATADAGRAPVPPLSPGLALLAALAVGLVLRVGSAALREFREPHLAHPLEAERAVGASALALVRDPLPDGPLRFRPSGVDPFRVLYLGLTATGTRTRALIVTGEDPLIVAAVGARLAIAAAADHRTTLVGEVDSEQIALSRVFRDHAEPGFSDALAGSFKWREVARAVGSSDGLAITMLPAGTTRDPLGEDALRAGIAGFQAFRDGFEFTILAVSLRDLERARLFLPGAPTVLCATIAETPVAAFQAAGAAVQASGERLHSIVLWDAPRPTLPSRAELAAYLSKRKGRTPGGSFKAVQEATKKPV